MLMLGPGARAQGFDVSEAKTRLVDGVYLLDAALNLDFSDESVQALNSGVELTVIVDLKIIQSRRYVWDKSVAELEARHRLRTHALTNQYIVENLKSGAIRSFRTLSSALEALEKLSNFPVLDAHLLDPKKRYDLRMRVRLDIESLPSPLRPVAYLSSLWRRDSDWSTWPMTP